jgi:formylglycine-generating enzyme required for sulfatase activity
MFVPKPKMTSRLLIQNLAGALWVLSLCHCVETSEINSELCGTTGDTRACLCQNDDPGTQSCEADGSWSDCSCERRPRPLDMARDGQPDGEGPQDAAPDADGRPDVALDAHGDLPPDTLSDGEASFDLPRDTPLEDPADAAEEPGIDSDRDPDRAADRPLDGEPDGVPLDAASDSSSDASYPEPILELLVVSAPVPRTGQLTRWISGDDGDLQMGVRWPTPRFTDHADGTITDDLTGLMWEQAPSDSVVDWPTALSHTADLMVGGYDDWRLPNAFELQSLVNYGVSDNLVWLQDEGFSTIQPWCWTSSSLVESATDEAWMVHVERGRFYHHEKVEPTWPGGIGVIGVRGTSTVIPRTGQTESSLDGDDGDLQMGVPWPDNRFISDPEEGTVIDQLTGLMWQYSPSSERDWAGALAHLDTLPLGGFDDWRLPNINEIATLRHLGVSDNTIWLGSAGFGAVGVQSYWTSTTAAYGPSDAWVFLPVDGGLQSEPKTDLQRTWAVRTVAPDFILIPAGTFTMGAPEEELGQKEDETQHEVTLTRDIFIQAREVTQDDWEGLMGNNPSHFSDDGEGATCGGDCPVDQVAWWEALCYANALSVFAELEPCYTFTVCDCEEAGTGSACARPAVTVAGDSVYDCEGYRLPTEAEWEYAARSGTTTATYNGDLTGSVCADRSLPDIAWISCNSDFSVHPTGRKLANAWGLHDVLGNVWEWVWDRYGAYPEAAIIDPIGPDSGLAQVNRGGSWQNASTWVRAAIRGKGSPDRRGISLGFRLARTAP